MAQAGLTPSQCRVARIAVGLSQEDLAKEASVSLPVVQGFETGGRIPIVNNLRAIRTVLEQRKVRFQQVGGGMAGIIFPDGDSE